MNLKGISLLNKVVDCVVSGAFPFFSRNLLCRYMVCHIYNHSTTITGLQGFWRILFHDARTCCCQVFMDGCFSVCKESVIQKVVVGSLTEILCC